MAFLTQQDLDKIEQAFGITLPTHYKQFHLTQTEWIQKMRETDGCPEDDTLFIATNVNYIIEMNQYMGVPKTEGEARGKFFIGGDGCGSSVLIDLNNPNNETVYFLGHGDFEYHEIFDPETNDFNWAHEGLIEAPNLGAYVQQQITFNIEFDKEYEGE